MNTRHVEVLLKVLIIVVTCISIYNTARFLFAL